MRVQNGDGIPGGSIPRRLYVLMAVTGCVISFVMAGGFFFGVRLSTIDAPLTNAAVRVRLEAAIANLMVEEMAGTGVAMNINSNWASLDRSVSDLEGMISKSNSSFFSSGGGIEIEKFDQVELSLTSLRGAAIERLSQRRRTPLPQPADETYHRAFSNFMTAVTALEQRLQKMQSEHFIRFRQTQMILILFSLILLGAICIVFIRFGRHRAQIIRSLVDARAAMEKEMTARQAAQQALKERSIALQESNKALEQFAYVASHDLQEPLRMVASYVRLLERRYKGRLDTDADEFIGFALEGTDRMQEMIEALLEYSRIDARGRPPTRIRSDVALEKAVSNLKVAISESRACIRQAPLPHVWGDETQLITLFQNLISNAIKFRGSTAPAVCISCTEAHGYLVFSIRDNGIGIDPKFSDRIFNIFDRLHTFSEYPGTGMGLAICKKIVDRHGGRIWAGDSPGHGATISFSLPSPPAEDAMAVPAAAGSDDEPSALSTEGSLR